MIEKAEENRLQDELIATLAERLGGQLPAAELANSDLAEKAEASLRDSTRRWDLRRNILFGVIIVGMAASLALSPYVLILNLLVVLIGSRYVGRFPNVVVNALAALYPTIQLLLEWFKKDPAQCENWCKDVHPEFQVVFATLTVKKLLAT